ncbi:MAG: DUF3836 domain-containing protein [Bacteroides sp.]|nr:DUF3836 domain-containing protein [Bacteroides sp.]
MKTLVLSVVIAMTAIVNAVSDSVVGKFTYNTEMDVERVEATTVFTVEDGKYLHNHLKYNYTYDADNRVSQKEVMKWNEMTKVFEKQYRLNFIYSNNEVPIEYTLWNQKDNTYTEVKSKAIYQAIGENINYQSYEWNAKESAWDLTVAHSMTDENSKLLALRK